MKENIVQKLTSKDDKYAYAFTDRITGKAAVYPANSVCSAQR